MLLKDLIQMPSQNEDVIFKVLASTVSGNYIPWKYPSSLELTKREDLLKVLQGFLYFSETKGETQKVLMTKYHLSLLLENSDRMFDPEPPTHIFQVPLSIEKTLEIENIITIVQIDNLQQILIAIPNNIHKNDFHLRLGV